MANGGQYRADNRLTINNVAELNLIVEALQDKSARVLKARIELESRGTPISRMMWLKEVAIGKILDRLRVGWKAADSIPEEIQQQLASREDKRFWTNMQSRLEELELEAAAEHYNDPTAENLYPFF